MLSFPSHQRVRNNGDNSIPRLKRKRILLNNVPHLILNFLLFHLCSSLFYIFPVSVLSPIGYLRFRLPPFLTYLLLSLMVLYLSWNVLPPPLCTFLFLWFPNPTFLYFLFFFLLYLIFLIAGVIFYSYLLNLIPFFSLRLLVVSFW